jgi:exosortase
METQRSFAAPMTAVRQAAAGLGQLDVASLWDAKHLPAAITAVFFALLFGEPLYTMSMDWWTSPEAGHGLLLAPVAIWLAWRQGIRADAAPNRSVGLAILIFAVAVRCAAGMAMELFSMRASVIMAVAGLTTYRYGLRQVLHWWLPFALGSLAIPLPELVKQALALPLQFRASRMGAALLHMRNVPVMLSGNVIRLPGHELFVTEACSGLRSLTALISVAVLMSALVLRSIVGRVILVLLAIPIAIVVNGIRVFMTGFFVFFVGNEFGQGFMHLTEGWLLFIASMSALALVAWVGLIVERRVVAWRMERAIPNA